MTSDLLGKELREGSGEFLSRRRVIVALSLANVASMGLIALYQVGVIAHVPEPPLPGFDADRVNGSADAYAILETPDAILGLGSYAATMALAAMGRPTAPRRGRGSRWHWRPRPCSTRRRRAGSRLTSSPSSGPSACSAC